MIREERNDATGVKNLELKSSSNTVGIISTRKFTGVGRYFDQSPILIWGARLTTSYEDPSALFFDFWINSQQYLHPNWIVFKAKSNLNKTNFLEDDLIVNLTFSLVWKKKPQERITNCTVQPKHNIDTVAREALHRFRCNLSVSHSAANVSEEESLEFRLLSLDGKEAVDFVIRRDSDAVGVGGSLNALPSHPFFRRRKIKFTLCVGGISVEAIPFLLEFLRHHIRIGVDYFILSLHGSTRSPRKADVFTLYSKVELLLWPFIEAGVVSLTMMQLPSFATRVHRDILKLVFYEQCLFQAKGQSEYVANWDIDEFFVPLNGSSGNPPSMLAAIVDHFVPHSSCPDWCYISFPSYSVFFPPGESVIRATSFNKSIAETFTVRSTDSNYVWQKSIAKTKNAFGSGCEFSLFYKMKTKRKTTMDSGKQQY